MRLPSGKLVRGRGLRHPLPDGPIPAFGVYLLGRPPPAVSWESRWIRWPDFRLPADESAVLPALTEAWERAATERVEIACAGGHGRTWNRPGLPGHPRRRSRYRGGRVRPGGDYDRHAVETPAQRRYVARWPGNLERDGAGQDASACPSSLP